MPVIKAVVETVGVDRSGANAMLVAYGAFLDGITNPRFGIVVNPALFGNAAQLQSAISQAVVDSALSNYSFVIAQQEVLICALSQG